jgi:alpha-aminoadipic semialdehyde synthase
MILKTRVAAALYTIAMRTLKIGIRRETKNRWECRAPLTPTNIQFLLNKQPGKVDFVVQPSTRRVFTDQQYRDVGASVNEDLTSCDLIVGVKEVPIEELIPNKQFLFFSHTHKGQPYNMPLLRRICDQKITLIDYELLRDGAGRRLVAFGAFAGFAGMINCLHGLGDRLLTAGYRTPFLVPNIDYLW